MKKDILKIAGVKSEKEFYKKYPTEAAFMKAHKKEFKKAAMGASMVQKQLTQLTDFSNPPKAEVGDYIGGGQSSYKPSNYTELYDSADYANTGSNRKMRMEDQALAAQQAIAKNSGKGILDQLMGGLKGMTGGLDALSSGADTGGLGAGGVDAGGYTNGINETGASFADVGKYGKRLRRAQGGDMISQFGPQLTSYKKGNISSPTGQVSKQQTEALGFKSDGSNYNTNKFALGMKNFGKDVGEGYDKLDSSLGNIGGVGGALGVGTDLLEGFQQLKQEKQQQQGAHQAFELSGLTKQVAGLTPDIAQRKYVRPEDQAFGTQQLGQAYGVGTNYLARNGMQVGGNPTEIQNMYNPGDIYSDMGYEPLSDSEIVKQYRQGGLVPKAQFGIDKMAGQAGGALGSLIGGGHGRPTAGGKIGSTIGSTVGKFIPIPGASAVLGAVGGIVGGIAGGKSAKKTENWETGTQQNTQDAAFMSGAQGLRNQFGNVMKEGGSIVDYMASKGMNNSYKNRKELYKKVFGDNEFSGTAEENTKLLEYLKSGNKPTISSNKESTKTTSSKKQDFGPIAKSNQFGSYDPTVFPENRNLESGVIVDKNTNNAYILKGNKIIKSFPVLTGQARDVNINERGVKYTETHPETRATPTGSYFMNPSKDIYGEPGFNLNPISAFNDPAPRARALAEHITYNPSERDKYYDLPGEQRNKSHGCVNCKKPEINQLTSMFPKGDTTMVIDTRNLLDKALLSNLSKKEDGGWVSHDWQPQVITQFGDYDMKDLLREDETMDTLRSGGHLKDYEYTPLTESAMSTERPNFAMGGELQTHWGGDAETISYNPYLPGDGETVMFRGQSHEESDGQGRTGIGVTYGNSPVEVERGEPAVKLQDGGEEESLVVYGNMKIPSYGVSELGDLKAKGKKFKNYANDLSKQEAKHNRIVEKGLKLIDSSDENDPFDLLKLNSGQAMLMGANEELKALAIQKQRLAGIQNAILDTAEEMGVESDALSKGQIKRIKNSDMAKFGGKFTQAQVGTVTKPSYKTSVGLPDPLTDRWSNLLGSVLNRTTPVTVSDKDLGRKKDINIRTPDIKVDKKDVPTLEQLRIAPEKKEDRFGLDDALRQLQPYLIPSNQEAFDYGQLTPEMYAMASNQLEPVQAQTFQPLLEQPYSVSFQDQLNANQADFNAIQRQMGYNPAAASALAAQKYAANSAILGQQFRANQEMQMGAFNRNRGVLNDAAIKNLAILDQQYQRQSQAKSATKAQAQAALSSIADKIAKHKLENKTLGVYENMYNYRFGPKGRAINVNAPVDFNTELASMSTEEIQKMLAQRKNADKKSAKNGSIVKAIKNL